MRLATFNVLHGRSLADGLVSNTRLVEACASLAADVLGLQEIDRNQARSGGIDQTRAVAEGTGAVAWRFEPALVGEPGATWRAAADDDDPDTADAGYGVGLVSRLPVRAWHVVRLRAAKVRAPVAVPGGRGRVILLPDEPRVALAAEVQSPAGPLLVATTHLSFVPGWNVVQLRQVTRALAAFGLPCVLLGDLNMPGGLPAAATGWRALARLKTFPGAKPSLQIDHALGHGLLPLVAGFSAPALALSDHRALIVDLG
ncbi:MAG TPA: endonuclease/exonuclease/phosphatase family protein [Acidimicrobiales bacterium]|nr:endonuclease/exonuclease/phosphatase family protein [Acidimicrobiales bacterium]